MNNKNGEYVYRLSTVKMTPAPVIYIHAQIIKQFWTVFYKASVYCLVALKYFYFLGAPY